MLLLRDHLSSEIPILKDLLDRGTKNGVEGLELISAEEAMKLEPNIKCVAALNSPNTG
jgi:L-2-hydroxyglutarate oxidase LhgO